LVEELVKDLKFSFEWADIRSACGKGYAELVDLLLNHKKSDLSGTCDAPYCVMDAAINGHVEVLKVLLLEDERFLDWDARCDSSLGNPLDKAAKRGHMDVLKLLMTAVRISQKSRSGVMRTLGKEKAKELSTYLNKRAGSTGDLA